MKMIITPIKRIMSIYNDRKSTPIPMETKQFLSKKTRRAWLFFSQDNTFLSWLK